MKSNYHPFPETHWSLVRRAGDLSASEHRESLRVLLHRYGPALRSYLINVRRVKAGEADDLLQSFIADKILEERLLRHADERCGRFRSFLLTCLNNFMRTRHRGKKDVQAVGLTAVAKQESSGVAVSVSLEAEWARSLLRNVLEAMREECARSGREDVWAIFDQRVLATIVRNEISMGYEHLAEVTAVGSPSQAANLLVTAKRMYARLLRRAIAEYEETDEGIEQEIADLRDILSRAPRAGDKGSGDGWQ
jgi:RNA polymerase sigma-70 factor (ECF subfamily)